MRGTEIITVNTGKLLREGGDTSPVQDLRVCPFHTTTDLSPKEFQDWDKLRLSLYKDRVLISESLIDAILANRKKYPPFGLIGENGAVVDFDPEYPFDDLSLKMRNTIFQARDRFLDEVHRGKCSKTLTEAVSRAGGADLSGYIEDGLIATSVIMPKALRLIPDMYPDPQPTETYVDLAGNSSRLVLRLADQHAAEFSGILKVIKIDGLVCDPRFGSECFAFRFNPAAFRIIRNLEGGPMLEIKPEVEAEGLELVSEIRAQHPDSDLKFGCAGKRKLKELWMWSVQIGRYIYDNY